jgi:hypothetical protein
MVYTVVSKTSKGKICNTSKKSNRSSLPPIEPLYSEAAKRWRDSKRNYEYFDAFDEVIAILNRDENRKSKANGDGYDYRRKACHQHITKKMAIFFCYVETQLHVLAVMQHVNDNNLWKPL